LSGALCWRAVKRPNVLRKARSSVARTGIEELVADARVRADALSHVLDVCAEHLGQVGELVHERYARGQHSVRRVFGKLGRAHVHDEQPLMAALERRVDRSQQHDGPLVLRADHDAVRSHEILDGGAFLEKLRVRYDREGHLRAASRELQGDALPHAVGGADRNRGLVDDNLVVRHSRADRARRSEHMLHVRRAVLVGRRAYRDELQRPMLDGGIHFGGEVQPLRGDVAPDHLRQARLVDRHPAPVQNVDLVAIDIEAKHVVAHLRQAGSGHEPDITRAGHRDFQAGTPSVALIAASAATGSAACVMGRPITR
jgi:hypothetical protein